MYEITGLRNSKIVDDQLPFDFDFKLIKRQYFTTTTTEYLIQWLSNSIFSLLEI